MRSTTALLAAIVLVALNLRIALSSLPTVVVLIQQETGWSDTLIGTLTTIPVFCMGLFALLVPRLAHRVGRGFSVSLALITMAVAMLLRLSGPFIAPLAISALLAGIAIAIIGGLVPSIVREQLSNRLGIATSMWTAAMMGGAALGAATTLPLASWLGGWNRALAFWAIPAVVALVAWTAVERPRPQSDTTGTQVVRLKDLPWRNSIAWSLTALTTLNSIVFYSAIAWIAPSYVERGYPPETAAVLFGLFTGIHILGALILPAWAFRSRYRRTIYSGCVAISAVAVILIAVVPTFVPALTIAVLGFTLSAGFAIPMGMLSEYPASPLAATRLTAMALSVTFSVAAFGPLLAGLIMDTVNSWTLVFFLLAVVLLLQLPAVFQLRRGITID